MFALEGEEGKESDSDMDVQVSGTSEKMDSNQNG